MAQSVAELIEKIKEVLVSLSSEEESHLTEELANCSLENQINAIAKFLISKVPFVDSADSFRQNPFEVLSKLDEPFSVFSLAFFRFYILRWEKIWYNNPSFFENEIEKICVLSRHISDQLLREALRQDFPKAFIFVRWADGRDDEFLKKNLNRFLLTYLPKFLLSNDPKVRQFGLRCLSLVSDDLLVLPSKAYSKTMNARGIFEKIKKEIPSDLTYRLWPLVLKLAPTDQVERLLREEWLYFTTEFSKSTQTGKIAYFELGYLPVPEQLSSAQLNLYNEFFAAYDLICSQRDTKLIQKAFDNLCDLHLDSVPSEAWVRLWGLLCSLVSMAAVLGPHKKLDNWRKVMPKAGDDPVDCLQAMMKCRQEQQLVRSLATKILENYSGCLGEAFQFKEAVFAELKARLGRAVLEQDELLLAKFARAVKEFDNSALGNFLYQRMPHSSVSGWLSDFGFSVFSLRDSSYVGEIEEMLGLRKPAEHLVAAFECRARR